MLNCAWSWVPTLFDFGKAWLFFWNRKKRTKLFFFSRRQVILNCYLYLEISRCVYICTYKYALKKFNFPNTDLFPVLFPQNLTYRVLIEYCVFFKEKFAASPSPALGCYWLYKKLGVLTVNSHCVENFEGLLQWCRRGRGCSEL